MKKKKERNLKGKGDIRGMRKRSTSLLPSIIPSDHSIKLHPNSKFRPWMTKEIFKLAKIGLTNSDIADFLEINRETFGIWERSLFRVSAALKKGRMIGKRSVTKAAFDAITAKRKPAGWHILSIFWLKNRYPEEWKDRHDIAGQITTDNKLTIEVVRSAPAMAIDIGKNAPQLAKVELLGEGEGKDKGEGIKTPPWSNKRDIPDDGNGHPPALVIGENAMEKASPAADTQVVDNKGNPQKGS